MYTPNQSLWWDGKASDIDTNGIDATLLLALSTMELNVDDDFLSKSKGAYSSWNQFSGENELRGKRQTILKSLDGLDRCHYQVVIPRPAGDSKRKLLLEYDDSDDHLDYRRFTTSLFTRYWLDNMLFYCKLYWHHCMVCKRVEPDRKGGVALQHLDLPQQPCEIVGIDYVFDLPKRDFYGYTHACIMACHLNTY